MLRGWKLGHIAGIGVYVHWTFFFLPAYVAYATLSGGGTVANALLSVGLIFAIFGCVVLHELGHALSARKFGIRTHSITLYPIGGVAALESIPRRPWQELVIALAGPAVNVFIAGALFLVLAVAHGSPLPSAAWLATTPLLGNLLLANIVLVLFNLLPAFPMDGGRVVRAMLATKFPYAQATDVAATIGKVLAVGFAILGLMGNLSLLLVAIFVFMAATAEQMAARRPIRPKMPQPRPFATPVTANPDIVWGDVVSHNAAPTAADAATFQYDVVDLGDGRSIVFYPVSRS